MDKFVKLAKVGFDIFDFPTGTLCLLCVLLLREPTVFPFVFVS